MEETYLSYTVLRRLYGRGSLYEKTPFLFASFILGFMCL